MRTIKLYGLVDPRDSLIYYVGKTIDPLFRYSDHLQGKNNKAKAKWIKELASVGLRPRMRILCEVPEEQADAVEAALIEAYASAAQPLTNIVRPTSFVELFVDRERHKITDYPLYLGLSEAACFCTQFIPHLYPTKKAASQFITAMTRRNRIPGAVKLPQNNRYAYHRDKLYDFMSLYGVSTPKIEPKCIEDYPEVLTLDEAVNLATKFMPERYPDKQRAWTLIRTASYRGVIPGAWRDRSESKKHTWRYDRTQLIAWLAEHGSIKQRYKQDDAKPL